MKRAINPQTGEVVFLVNNEWVSPSQTAVNEAGDKAYLIGNEWYVPPVPAAPTLSPEEQMMAPIGADTTGGIELSDYGKLFGAGAVKSTLGAPEAIQAGTSGIARDTATKPTDILNYLADPRKLANDLAQAVRLPKIFEDEAKLGIVPEKTAEKQKAAIDEALTKGKLQSLRDLTAYGTKVAERIEDSVTPEMKEALADSQPTGNIIEALETGDFSKISLGKDPSLAGIVGQAAKVFGSTAPAILTAVVSKSPTVGGIAGFGQAGSEGVEAAREHIKSMSNEELAEKSEYFRNLLALGYKPDVARKMTEEKAADTAAYYQGMVGALGNQFTANLIKGNLDDVLLASAKSRLAKIVKGTAAGMTEEGLQELAEGIATDLGIDRTVVREMGVDSFANVVLGAIGGGAPGGFRGAISKDKEAQPTETPEVRPNVTPVTPEGTPVATAPEVTPAATTPPAPPAAPVSGAIAAEELETAEEAPKVTPPAAPAVAPAPVAEAPASPELAELQREYDDLNAKLAAGQVPADQFTEVNDRLADLQAAISEVKAGKAPEIKVPEIKKAPEVPAPAAPVEQVVKAEKPVESPIQPSQLQEIIDKISGIKDVNKNEVFYLESARDAIAEGRIEEGLKKLRQMVGLDTEPGNWASDSRKDLIALLSPFTKKPVEKTKAEINKERQAAKKAAAQQKEAPVVAEPEADYARKIMDFRGAGSAKSLIKKYGQAFLDEAEKAGDIRSYTIAKQKNYTTTDEGEQKYYNSIKTNDGKYTLKQIHDAYDDALQENGHANILKTYEFMEKYPADMLQSALDSGFVSINDAGSIWPSYDAADVERRAEQEEKIDVVKESKRHKAEDDVVQEKFRKEYEEKTAKELKKAQKKPAETKEEKAEANRKRQAEKKAKAEGKTEFKKLRGTKTEDGFKIQNPIMTGLVDIGYEMLDLRNPRTYVDKNGTPFRTFEKNGVRIALEPSKILFKQEGKESGRVATGIGNENDITVEHLFVDPQFRKQGLARQALKDLTFLADKNKINMYLEPAQLEESGMNKEQLSKLYSEFLWEPTNESGSPMKRVPETYEEAMARINAKMKAEGRESEYEKAAKDLEATKAKIAELQAKQKGEAKDFDAYVDEVSDQIDNIVDYARMDNRTGVTREEVIKRLKASYEESPEKAQSVLDNTEANMMKAAKERAINDLKVGYYEATGKYSSKEADVVRAIKSGVLDISDNQDADNIYKLFDIKKSDIKKVSTEGGVPALIDKFSGSFFGKPKEVSEEVYDQAAKQFLEGPLTAKVPTGKMDSIDPRRINEVSPQPIPKTIKQIGNTFADKAKVLYQIAAKQDIRYYLNGVHVDFKKNRIVATDGHRAAVINTSLKDAPKPTGNLTVYTKDNKYIDGVYPDIDRVIPLHADNKVTFDVKPLGDHARGANKAWRYISSKMAAPIQLAIGDKSMSFNAKYIEDMTNLFQQLGYDKADISITDSGRLFATSPDGKVQQVIMSMREDRPLFARYSLDRGMVISGEGLIREITPKQVKLLEKSVDKLSESELHTLEKHYNERLDSKEFLKRIRDDATKYINDGAEAVDKAIRSIIAKVAAAILSVAIVFNPNFMSDASAVVIPQQVVEVRAEVPKDASGMSDAGKKAYATLYPALKQGLQKNNKYFTVVDKPTSQMFVFNPDGSMLLKSNVLLGSQFGDTYVGQTDFKQNRMTPAGLFKPKAEKGSATYDGKTVYTFGNVKEGWNAVFMHSVYLKAGDAEARLKALETGDKTRLSYGCVNGPDAVMEKLDNQSMDESHVFIVPDNQAAVDDYIANRVSNEDLTRETVKPATTKVPSQRAKAMSEQEVFGREEELPLEPKKTQAEINRDRQKAKRAVAESEDKTIFYGNFTGDLTPSDLDAMNEEVRDEKILELAKISRKITTLTKKIAGVGGDIETQKRLNYLLGKQADLRNEIDATKPERRSADWFRARAAEELAKGNLMPETMAVIDELYRKYPSFLEGLKLSVRAGKRAGVEGSFEPIDRLVSIFKNPFSITQDETMRHEIMHSLEQMMTPEAQKALVSAWANGLSKAIEKHKDPASQEFFNAVLDYVENPTKANYRKATNKMPNIRFYQYMNPSEFWAVNGEKLMKSQLGSPWARFVKGVQKILEALKNVFGFDNRYAVHREFDRLMKGEAGQMTDKMLADYLRDGDVEIEFLNQVEDVDELLEKHERPNAPLHPSDKLKDRLLQKTESITELFDQYKNNPRLETSKMIGAADRAITYARNKNVWFGTGLELADLKRYNGQLRDDKGFAVASIALTNAVHAGHVGTQVITHGGLRFDPVTQQFTAYDSKYSLANVVREKTKLIAKLGEQRAADVIQAFFEAKRSRSIQNEFYDRQAEFENLKAEFESELDADRKDELYKEMMSAEEDLRRVMVALDKVNMTDEAIDDFIALEKKYPELKEMMRNWTAVNQNMIDNMEFSGIISKKRAERLRAIKDYVPWYRIQDDMADPHDRPAQGVRGLTNVAGEKKFKKGQTDKDIDDIVDNMIHNVMMTTRNSIRNYAANRIAQQYATRNDKGKIKVFPQEGTMKDGAIRVNILANGRRIVVEIKDPLIAESVLGMESIEIPMIDALAILANGLRRGITSNPIFQVKQLFMDAPTAAWVSGVKNPFKVWGDTFMSFAAALNPNDPIVKMMKNYGIGGYQSSSRTPEKELKMQIGLIGRSPLAYMLKMLDHIGDASDYAQRRAVYKQVLKETGDEMQALLQANNVIDFLKHGSGRAAQATVRTVAFMNAYAQSMDVMAQAMAGGGLKGKERKQVFAQFVKTGMVLASLSLLYSFAIGDDDEYQKMDDQTKVRNFIIPKSMTKYIGMDNSIKVPMHTSASFFFKSVPELLYNKIMNEGTKNHVDNQRLRTALKEAATDALLGPNVTPTGVKPFLEIALNKNFFTGGTITPKGMENLEAFRQYTANTSELGKIISKGTFGLLNPIEADHLMKGLLGTVGAAAMWGSNMFSGDRAEPNASSNPFYGAFVSAPVPRGPEDIYYDLKERSTKVHDTFIDMMKKGRSKEATEYRKENEKLFKAYGYTNGVEQSLKKLNAEIRRVGDLPGEKLSPEEKRERITYYQQKKNDVLKDVIEYRKRAGL